jgi:hypothetical protein
MLMDGKWTSPSEWNDSMEIPMLVAEGDGRGYFRCKHDEANLYVLAESLTDTSIEYNRTLNIGDYMTVFLDTLHNDGNLPLSDDYRFLAYYVNREYTELWRYSAIGNGTVYWDKINPLESVQAKVNLDDGNSPYEPHPHVIGEFRIPLIIIPAETFGFAIRLDNSSFWTTESPLTLHFYWPGPTHANQAIDPSSWGDVSLSSTPIPEFRSTWFIIAASVLAVMVIFRLKTKTTILGDKMAS